LPSVVPQPGNKGVTHEELAAKVAASFEVSKPPQVTQPEAMTVQPDHKAESAATGAQLQVIQETITNLPDQVAQTVSEPIRQVRGQITAVSRPDDAERSIQELVGRAKGPADLQAGVNELRPAHIDAHHDLEHQEQAA